MTQQITTETETTTTVPTQVDTGRELEKVPQQDFEAPEEEAGEAEDDSA